MSTPQEQYRQVVQSSQEAVLNAVDTWTRTVQETVGSLPTPAAQVDPTQVIDQVFDFAEKMLEMQRDFAKNLVQASATVADSATRGVQDATETAGA
jgi:hypothetical protein